MPDKWLCAWCGKTVYLKLQPRAKSAAEPGNCLPDGRAGIVLKTRSVHWGEGALRTAILLTPKRVHGAGEFKRARELSLGHLLTRSCYAECLTRMKRYDQALAESARAVALDPVSPLGFGNRGMIFSFAPAAMMRRSKQASKRSTSTRVSSMDFGGRVSLTRERGLLEVHRVLEQGHRDE
jgi:hypothetical protein